MGLGDRYIENAHKAAEATLGEPVEVSVFVARAGAMAAGLRPDGPALAKRDKLHRPGGKDTRLPQNFLMIVTARQVHFHRQKMFWGSVKVKKRLGTLERQGLVLELSGGDQQFHLTAADGSEIRFEMMRWGAKGNALMDKAIEVLRRSG